jgi:hypothetical protein
MPASYPKPDDQKVTRHAPKFGWTELPSEGRSGPPPELPKDRIWQALTLEWWARLWTYPEATQWKQDGSTLVGLACLWDDLFAGRMPASRLTPEIRQFEDRHGLNPKAMLQLRWRVVGDELAERRPKPKLRALDRRLKAAK